MTMLTPAVRDVLTAGRPAHLVTINADGSPQVSIVWVGLDRDEIVSGHLGVRQKLRNVERDPRVVLSLETGHRNAIGLDEYLVVRAGHHKPHVAAVGVPPQVRLPTGELRRWVDLPAVRRPARR